MANKPAAKPDDPEQSKRFIDTAKELEANDSKALDRAFKKVASAQKQPLLDPPIDEYENIPVAATAQPASGVAQGCPSLIADFFKEVQPDRFRVRERCVESVPCHRPAVLMSQDSVTFIDPQLKLGRPYRALGFKGRKTAPNITYH